MQENVGEILGQSCAASEVNMLLNLVIVAGIIALLKWVKGSKDDSE